MTAAHALLSDAEIAAIRRPIESARTFPRRAFTSPEFYAFEVEHLLRTSWMAVAFGAEIAQTGTLVPMDILGEPVLLVRDGIKLRAFHNIGPYDGCEVAIEPATGLERVVTPYHGWEYALDGRLLQAGYWDGTPAAASLDPTTLSADLVPIACAEWFGVVFVRLAASGETFEQYLAPVLAYLDDLQLDALAPGLTAAGEPDIATLPIGANWKTVYENYAPNVYHESFVHAMYRKSPDSPRVDADGNRTYEEIIDDSGFIGLQYDNRVGSSFYPDSPFAPLRDRAGEPSRRNLIVNGYPNWAVTWLNHYARMAFWLPQGPQACTQKIATYYQADQAVDPSLADDRRRAARGGVIAREEDNRICESIQRARRSRALESQFYCPFWDRPHYALTNQLLDRLLEAGNSG